MVIAVIPRLEIKLDSIYLYNFTSIGITLIDEDAKNV